MKVGLLECISLKNTVRGFSQITYRFKRKMGCIFFPLRQEVLLLFRLHIKMRPEFLADVLKNKFVSTSRYT